MHQKKLVPLRAVILSGIIRAGAALNKSIAQANYRIFISNEKSGNVSVLNGNDFQPIEAISVGKRPRGIHASPDGKTLYVAVSGTPIDTSSPPDAQPDKAADGIAIVDLTTDKFLRRIPAGSNPTQFAISPDGKRLCVANQDAGTATVLDLSTEKIIASVRVTAEPEGVGASPDSNFFYVGCNATGDIFAIETSHFKVAGQIKADPGLRSIDFLPDSSKAFAASESSGAINVIDTRSQTLVKRINLPKDSRPTCIRTSADGRKIFASMGPGGTICVVDTGTEQIVGNLRVHESPVGIALSPDGKFLFSVNGPSDDVSVVDLAMGKEVVRVKLADAANPWGIAIVPSQK